MPLAPGTRLGPYEIAALIGAGGMGEVYRAKDPRMGREVAIKVSAEQFSERFSREVRAIASLNHPNICTLYDVGPNYLVMELIEGPTLAERIRQGAAPLDEVLAIAHQIADALEAAHEKGIIHRDLKPENVKLRADGTVKVLDFGLAKAVGPASAADPDHSPTLTLTMTAMGMILGTAAYMAPEQARGKPVDKRADIWAFGVILFEMLTGERLFKGQDVTMTLAAVVKDEPDFSKVPKRVERLLRHCLQKDPVQRLRWIGDMDLLLEAPPAARGAPHRSMSRKFAPWATAALLLVIGSAVSWIHFREPKPAAPQVLEYTIAAPEGRRVQSFAVSPDGRYLAISATAEHGEQLWLRALDSFQAQQIPGTESARYPFWSPDSRSIAFFSSNKLKKIAIGGGPALTLCESGTGLGGTWGSDGTILFGSVGAEIRRVPAVGGVPVPVTRSRTLARFPVFLPDSRRFLYTDNTAGSATGFYAASLDAPSATPTKVSADSLPLYVPPLDPGQFAHLLFMRDQNLMAQPVDSVTLAPAGEVFPVAEQVSREPASNYSFYSTSQNGILVYLMGGADIRQHTWFDRTGKLLGTVGPLENTQGQLALSPNEKRLITYKGVGANSDLWIADLDRGTESRFSFEASTNFAPVWSPDGTRVVFSSGRGGSINLYLHAANGSGQDQVIAKTDSTTVASDWTRDGRYIIARETTAAGGQDLVAIPTSGDPKPIPLLTSRFNEVMGTVSPDGRWLAYASDESGRYEIYVQPFSPGKPAAGKWQISLNGGRDPRWRADGQEMFYVSSENEMTAVPVKASADSFIPGTPKPLFVVRYPAENTTISRYAVTADGKRFIMAVEPETSAEAQPLRVVVNWLAGVKK